MKAKGGGKRVSLERFIVANPRICHGKLTYRRTRTMVS